MFRRQTSGSVVCTSCGYLVGVNDEKCYHCGRRNPGLWGFAPVLRSLGHDMGFVPFVTGTCIVLYALGLLVSAMLGFQIASPSVFGFLAPSTEIQFVLGASGATPVFGYGRWWTVLSAGWLHGGLLHILFNVMWIRQLAPAVGELYGPGRMVIIYTLASAVGFTASSVLGLYNIPFFGGGNFTVGASAAIFGLLGALVYYGKRGGSSMVGSQAWSMAVFMFIFGLVMPGVDNAAHAGGFAGGYLAGRLLDPLKQERIDHMVGAVACLGLSILSIVVSVAHLLLYVLR
jgi:rhomboid protease GluP